MAVLDDILGKNKEPAATSPATNEAPVTTVEKRLPEVVATADKPNTESPAVNVTQPQKPTAMPGVTPPQQPIEAAPQGVTVQQPDVTKEAVPQVAPSASANQIASTELKPTTPAEIDVKNPTPDASVKMPEKNLPTEKKPETYADIVDFIDKKLRPSDEDLSKQQKEENRRALIGYIGDALSSMANLYYTSKGSLSTQLGSMTNANNKRVKEIRDRNQKQLDWWKNARLAASQRDMENAIEQRRYDIQNQHWLAQQERQNKQDETNLQIRLAQLEQNERRNGMNDANQKERLRLQNEANKIAARRADIEMYKATHKGVGGRSTGDTGSGSSKASKNSYEHLDYIADNDLKAGNRNIRTINIPKDQWNNGTIVNEMADAILNDPNAMAKVKQRGETRSKYDLRKLSSAQKQQFVKDYWLFSQGAINAAGKAADISDWSQVPYKNGASSTSNEGKTIPFNNAGKGKGKSISWAN